MDWSKTISLLQPAVEQGLFYALTVLALFLSYSMLNVCDLSTDGCFTLGATVGALIVVKGHPYLSIPGAMAVGMISGFVTAFLQTRMGINSLLSGIIVNTILYSVNMAVMSGSPNISMASTKRKPIVTIFSIVKGWLAGTPFAPYLKLIIAFVAVLMVAVFLALFLRTKLGLAIRATGDNPDMVRSSSINPVFTITVGLTISNMFTALSGCLVAQSLGNAEINVGTGTVTIALASLLIGTVFLKRSSIAVKIVFAVVGSLVYQIVTTLALRVDCAEYMLFAIRGVIIILAISAPYLKSQFPMFKRRLDLLFKRGQNNA